MERGLSSRFPRAKKLPRAFAVFFALVCVVGAVTGLGTLVQSNGMALCVRGIAGAFGKEKSFSVFGVSVPLSVAVFAVVSAFLAAATVSVAGMIGFVGLVVPHIARLLVGSNYKSMLPVSIVLGSVVLLAADTVGRTVVPGMEIPVGIIMSVCGGPFFLYMLRKGSKSGS